MTRNLCFALVDVLANASFLLKFRSFCVVLGIIKKESTLGFLFARFVTDIFVVLRLFLDFGIRQSYFSDCVGDMTAVVL